MVHKCFVDPIDSNQLPHCNKLLGFDERIDPSDQIDLGYKTRLVLGAVEWG